MHVFTAIAPFKQARRALAGSLGLVPTMGALHEGHLSLVRSARSENDHVAASIFVNPKQFGPTEGLARYPRDLPRDLALLEKGGVDLVFAPEATEMYPPGFDTTFDVGAVARRLEGASRPGHFQGVATVVAKLFNIVEPTRAYFGQKDAQQVLVIRRLVRDLNLPVELRIMPTVREPDGLAMSSRNTYLSPKERVAAPVLWKALCAARDRSLSGERRAEHLRQAMRSLLEAAPLARIDYVSVADPDDLRELEEVCGAALVSLAVWIGKTRLIDNILLGPATEQPREPGRLGATSATRR